MSEMVIVGLVIMTFPIVAIVALVMAIGARGQVRALGMTVSLSLPFR